MKRTTHHIETMLTAAFLAATLGLVGCSKPPNQTNGAPGPEALCEADSECGQGQACARNVCTIIEAREARLLGFTFIPENSSAYLPQRSMQIEIEPTDQLDFVLESSILVSGDLSLADGPNVIEEGTLLFEPIASTDNLLRQQATIGADGSFYVELLPGRYDVTFIDKDRDLPNRRWLDIEIGQASTSLPLTLPSRSTLVTINGTITHRDPDLMQQASALPVAGARVVAVAADGTTSTVGISDEGGRYQLKVWGDTGVNDLSISPSSPATLIPRLVEEDAFDPGKQEDLTPSTSLGTWNARSIGFRVDGELLAMLEESLEALQETHGEEDPVDGDTDSDHASIDLDEFRVTARANLERGDLTVNFTLEEAVEGTIPLLATPHTITIRPPANSPAGVVSFELDGSSLDLFEIALIEIPLRERITGRVLDSNGNPLVGARVELRHLTQDVTTSQKSAFSDDDPRLLTLETNEEGIFHAWVEPSWEYDATIIPTTSSNAPTGIFHLEQNQDEATSRGEIEFKLAEPMLVHGSVLNEELEGQANLLIEVYEVFRGEHRVVGQTRTGSNGTFRFIAPAAAPRDRDASE